jgi:pimeloyl-ACP methyl ester carboxylesterase
VVGTSTGAVVALHLALQSPDLVRSLVLDSPPLSNLVTDPEDIERMGTLFETFGPIVDASDAGDYTQAVQLFAEWAMDEPGSWDSIDPHLQSVFLDNSRTIPLQFTSPNILPLSCEQLGQIAVPVTITIPQQARFDFPLTAEAVQGCVPGSQLVEVPDATIWAMVNNAPAFNEALLNHLMNVE